jgi:hypothetical protein
MDTARRTLLEKPAPDPAGSQEKIWSALYIKSSFNIIFYKISQESHYFLGEHAAWSLFSYRPVPQALNISEGYSVR